MKWVTNIPLNTDLTQQKFEQLTVNFSREHTNHVGFQFVKYLDGTKQTDCRDDYHEQHEVEKHNQLEWTVCHFLRIKRTLV